MHAMALAAESVSRLIKQTLVGTAVRLVAFNAARSLCRKFRSYRMFVYKGTGIFRMTILAGPVEFDRVIGPSHFPHRVTIDTIDCTCFIRMSRTSLEFSGHISVAGKAKFVTVFGQQSFIVVIMDFMAIQTLHTVEAMRISRIH